MHPLIGNTPIISLPTAKHKLYGKCEWLNLTGSIKDRVAQYIIENAKKSKALQPQQWIVEASSGNMGTSLSAIGEMLGHPVHITCPEKTGIMKRNMIEYFGADLTICPNTTNGADPAFYVNQAKQIAYAKDAYLVNQYDNSLNTECHYHTTGQEIVDYFMENDLSLDYFITVGGSGGTITGCAKKIKMHFPLCQVIMPDPRGSIYYDLFHHGKIINENIYGYQVEGPGNPIFCQSMDLSYIDQVIQFDDQDAFRGCLDLAKKYGIYAGHSSGANFYIAEKIIADLNISTSKNILIMVLDNGMKYDFSKMKAHIS